MGIIKSVDKLFVDFQNITDYNDNVIRVTIKNMLTKQSHWKIQRQKEKRRDLIEDIKLIALVLVIGIFVSLALSSFVDLIKNIIYLIINK